MFVLVEYSLNGLNAHSLLPHKISVTGPDLKSRLLAPAFLRHIQFKSQPLFHLQYSCLAIYPKLYQVHLRHLSIWSSSTGWKHFKTLGHSLQRQILAILFYHGNVVEIRLILLKTNFAFILIINLYEIYFYQRPFDRFAFYLFYLTHSFSHP